MEWEVPLLPQPVLVESEETLLHCYLFFLWIRDDIGKKVFLSLSFLILKIIENLKENKQKSLTQQQQENYTKLS